jgi:hypothetical protein
MKTESLPLVQQQIRQIERRLRLLTLCVAGLLLILGIGLFSAFSYAEKQRFTEIDVERINVIEADGRLAVVIANQARLPGNIIDGREFSSRTGISGLLFYNSEGDEAGGLVQSSSRNEDGTFKNAFGQLSLDRFESDQVVAMRYFEDGNFRSAGVQISDYPRHILVEWGAAVDSINQLPEAEQSAAMRTLRQRFFREGKVEVQRVFVGQQNETATLDLRDTKGRSRIRISVDSLDVARLEFLDEEGAVVYRLPER